MKLKIENFEIEEDKNCFILTEYWDIKDNKTWEIRYWQKSQTYPSTLARCFEKILHSLKSKNNKTFELEEYIKEIEFINNNFLEKINILITK